jgi:glycosyltransferase involved in cell wall biosynthesis
VPAKEFVKREGITIGIVSRLTPIKQFPMLFNFISPVLARYPEINLEIFGAGGYASVRDLKVALRPIEGRVRFWGNQINVTAVYGQIDYLLTGLPEREALGLNVIEAQACGTPILAPKSPPFTETVIEEVTGLFFTDPRLDAGADLDRLFSRLVSQPFKINSLLAGSGLQNFSQESFRMRVFNLCKMVNDLVFK